MSAPVSDPAAFAAALSPKAEFFDVEGIPVSENEPLAGSLYCAAWDVSPPRFFPFESARKNGAPIPAEEFARMVAVASLDSDAEFFDVEGIPVSLGEKSAGLYSAAWDVSPPREFPPDSARRNGAPINAAEFVRLVEEARSKTIPR